MANSSKVKKGSFQANTSKQPGNGFSNWQGFINVNLTDKDKQKALEFYGADGVVERAVEQVLMAGYRVTLKHEAGNNTFTAFMSHTDPSHPDAGWGLSERASSWWRAIQRIMFIHHVFLQGDWSLAKGDNFVDDDSW